MAMDAKDLRIESALGAHGDDGNTNYTQSGTAFQTNSSKTYHDIGLNSLAKVDAPTARPCAIIGPDRIVPPQNTNDAYVKKVPVEPWPCTDSIYQHPPEYPYKPTEYQLSRNISPRQTFQENMQRIMVPPSYTSVKNSEDHCLKNSKLTSLESKFCDVPYSISPINNEAKIVKSSEGVVPNNNSSQPVIPHGWSSNGVNVRPLRPYGAPDLYQYSEYLNSPAPRPISMIRPHRNIHEDMPQMYQDRYHEGNMRFKPYSATKERPLQNPHVRYDYIPNYPNAFHPHTSYPPHKYDIQKSIPTHPYSVYPPVPLKYLERRMPVPAMDKYSRSSSQQVSFNQPFCNQNIPASYGAVPGNCLQNRAYPFAPDPSGKNMIQNRIYFDSNNARKYYTSTDNMFINDINRTPNIKNDVLYPSYAPINIHSLAPHHMYRKESSLKGYEHAIHYRNMDYSPNMNPLGRLPLQFSPQNMSISPADSNTSNDTTQILGSAHEDCGYASQSSTASIRSMESGVNRISSDVYQRQDMTLSHMNKFGQKLDNITSPKQKTGLNVRQFLQMWNEGDDEGNDNSKEVTRQRDNSNSLGQYESGNNQEQLYVLGLVNVPKEELGKYDHIQKISKLPENIKGYSNIELLNQYEKLVESPSLNQFPLAPQTKRKDLHVPLRNSITRQGMEVSNTSARPISPLDVEAKISQSVIHKEVGCNFEIRPCSPQIMNVELATPVHNLLGERLIEKVINPVKIKSPIHHRLEDTNEELSSSRNSPKVQSCKMANNQYLSPNVNDALKTNYCLQDLESNSGVCLASLPRLDNDIELNFPEINQQFINANKMSSIRDLPILDTENCESSDKNKNPNALFTSEQLNPSSDLDKDVSKLSKYRKPKTNLIPNDNNDTSNISLHRTDSVIIKNPDNFKSQEDFINNMPLNTSPNVDNLITSVNVAAENIEGLNYSDIKKTTIVNETLNDHIPLDSDTAIDFSLGKSDDEQIDTNVLSNLSDTLESKNETNKTMDENIAITTNSSMELGNKKLTEQLEEIADADNFAISPPKSPILGNFTCSSILNNDTTLQSIEEENKTLLSHETVITHSKPKDYIASDTPLISILPLTEEIVPSNNLPSLSQDKEIVSENIMCNSGTSENVTDLNYATDNQAINYCLAEQPDVNTSICKLNSFEVDIKKNQDLIKDGNVEVGEILQDGNNKISAKIVIGSYPQSDSNIDTKKNIVSGSVAEAFEGAKIENVPVEFKDHKDMTNVILEEEIAISNKNTEIKEQCIETIICTKNNLDLEDKCSDDIHRGEKLTNVPKVNYTKPFHGDDLIATSINYKKRNEATNYTFSKALFSSSVQNLLIHIEGPYTSITNYVNEHNSRCIRSDKNNMKVSVEPHFGEKMIDTESEKITRNHVITIKSDDITSNIKTNISTECVTEIPMITEKKCVDLEDTNTDKLQETKHTTNDVEDVNLTKTFAVEKSVLESVLEVSEEKTHDLVSEKDNEINTTFNKHTKENNDQTSFCVQLPNKRNRTLKRSLSESAVNTYAGSTDDMKRNYADSFMSTKKRVKITDPEILVESQMLSENFTNFIQSNRRNSISTIYNEENVSFCILIENDCVLTEENEDCEKICYTEIPDECLTTICTERDAMNSELNEEISYEGNAAICNTDVDPVYSELTEAIYYEDNDSICLKVSNVNSELMSENIAYGGPQQCAYENDLTIENIEDRTIEETWVEDVACMETVFSEDIAEDIVISAPSSPKDSQSEDESSYTNVSYNVNENEHTKQVKHIYGNLMCDDDAQLVEKLYRTPQMDVNKTLIDRESQLIQEYNRYYDNESLEKLLSESNSLDSYSLVHNSLVPDKSSIVLPISTTNDNGNEDKENLKELFLEQQTKIDIKSSVDLTNLSENKLSDDRQSNEGLVHSCESSCDNVVSYKTEEKLEYAISSSPEVSSTTSEEKGPAILLKIRSYKGSKISEVNDMSANYTHTHSQRFNNSTLPTSRPLITKAAQKYIPPLKETIHDLKVKIHLPKQSLYKLQQLKKSKEEPKINPSRSKLYIKNLPQENPKKVKSKPKFEDVLMSIDKIQFKKHKAKNKKTKQSVPKVIIKKNENGAHYASTQAKESFNPDLTGRKWQPWVFLEKSNFVDKMALKQKFKAIYNHRKKTFVLAENFRKYKSISNAKFVISHPKSNDISTGKLKYTFRLKHDY